MRMLIIDDSNESREAMTYIFKRRGLIVESAMNEKEALSGMKEKPDIIIINNVFSEICGFEVGRRIKDDPRTQGIPLIFLTSLMYPSGIIHYSSGQVVEYIQKPCDIDYLVKEANTLVLEQSPPPA